jgi:hypothetical protein
VSIWLLLELCGVKIELAMSRKLQSSNLSNVGEVVHTTTSIVTSMLFLVALEYVQISS